MKLYGFTGKGSGKMGSSVFAISGGEQIVRQYNPVVSNPSTPAQVEQRAKLKLLSQLAAVLAPAIKIKKDGLVSARNKFVSINYPYTSYADGKASVEVAKLQLSESKTKAAQISVSAEVLRVSFKDTVNVDGVIIVLAEVNPNNNSELNLTITGIETKMTNQSFEETITGQDFVFVIPFGFDSATAKQKYEDYIASTTSGNADLTASIADALSGATFYHTEGSKNNG